MLTIYIPKREVYNEKTFEFLMLGGVSISLEHSLVSISKWESKWHKPFIGNDKLTDAEVTDYIKCMTVTKNVPDSAYMALSEDNMASIMNYIKDPMTATKIRRAPHQNNSSSLTSEVIYHLMIIHGIPFECQKWHINRLIMLISVCQENSGSPKMMSKADTIAQNKMLNAQRKAKMHTKG